MNLIQRLLKLRQASTEDDRAIQQAWMQLNQARATIAALAHPTEKMQQPHRKAG